jgi:hypothetical protein
MRSNHTSPSNLSFPRKRESSIPQRRQGLLDRPLSRAMTQPDYHSFNRTKLNDLDNGNIAQKLQRRDIEIIAKDSAKMMYIVFCGFVRDFVCSQPC